MQLEEYLEISSPEVIRLKGHRIGIEDVVERYHAGESVEQMALDFPGVSLEQLYGTIAYYLHHRATIDAYIARVNARIMERLRAYDAEPPSPLRERLRALRAQQERDAA